MPKVLTTLGKYWINYYPIIAIIQFHEIFVTYSEVELYKSGENWCLDPDDTDITFNLFKHPAHFDTIPATLYALKINGITAKPIENQEIFDEFFKIDGDDDNLKKFKIGEIIADNEVTLRTQQANNYEKTLLVKVEGYLALYQDLSIGKKHALKNSTQKI